MASARKKVLVVGNTNDAIGLSRDALSFHDFDVTGVTNPFEVFRLVEKGSYDILISDLILTPMGGLDLIEQIRLHHTPEDLPILVLTHRELSRQDRTRIRQAACAYLPNTSRIRDLVTKVAELVATKVPSRRSA